MHSWILFLASGFHSFSSGIGLFLSHFRTSLKTVVFSLILFCWMYWIKTFWARYQLSGYFAWFYLQQSGLNRHRNTKYIFSNETPWMKQRANNGPETSFVNTQRVVKIKESSRLSIKMYFVLPEKLCQSLECVVESFIGFDCSLLVASSTWSWTSWSRTRRTSSTCWSCWTTARPTSRYILNIK